MILQATIHVIFNYSEFDLMNLWKINAIKQLIIGKIKKTTNNDEIIV
jgi:hypothetical protein